MKSLIKNYLYRKQNRFYHFPLIITLLPFEILYRAIIGTKIYLHRVGIFSSVKLPVPVISVGNLTLGGTGKTPMVAFIARYLSEKKRLKVAILSRGYGRKRDASDIIIVSDGLGKKVSSKVGGDEPAMLAKLLPNAVVIVCNDRAKAGMRAVEEFHCNVCILDDGFQHLKVRRDLNILLFGALAPHSLTRTLPNGFLREPLGAMNRADCIVMTGGSSDELVQRLADKCKRYCQSFHLIRADFKPSSFYEFMHEKTLPLSVIADRKVLCFAGIAKPEKFKQTILSLSPRHAEFKFFPDHHWFTEKDVAELVTLKTRCNADFLITTEKDAVRLEDYDLDDFSCLVLRIELEFIDGERTFLRFIEKVV